MLASNVTMSRSRRRYVAVVYPCPRRFLPGFRVDVCRRKMGVGTAGGLTAMVLEIVVSGIGCDFLEVGEDGIGMLERELVQPATAIFPKLEIGCLHQILDDGSRRRTPLRGRSQNRQADRLMNPRSELPPCVIIARPCT